MGASWRLRRCDIAEAELGDFSDETDKLRRSVERARAAAHSTLHKSLNQLRKLQTQREIGFELSGVEQTQTLVDRKQVADAKHKQARTAKAAAAPTAPSMQADAGNDSTEDPGLSWEEMLAYINSGIPAELR